MKVILCGYNWVGCKALDILLEHNHEVFVYTHNSPSYVPSLKNYCLEKGISYSLKKINLESIPFKPDIVCSIYYRYIIPEDVIKYVNNKIFNLHPSLLPEYKGCSSLTWAMINGEKRVGFTYHYIESGVDTGDIILQKKIDIEEFDTQQTLYYRVMFESMRFFYKAFKHVINNKNVIKQSSNIGKYYKRGCPFFGEINDNWDDAKIKRFIRAMIFPPLPYAKYKGKEIRTYDDYLKIKKGNEDII